ncbi:efflux RND transporter periplasmic adaptor subunit [Rufibacter sp. LB8]|uniref:efflux RND transporter periplasmic adaptor subunit n=1 Tax=Rufibacter sp. LB8 TaxID=2777781 RepID=UPI00178C6777|nr:efflux RND transporter periplasmic adaptor subunit [Rufibacter sp. LB8]
MVIDAWEALNMAQMEYLNNLEQLYLIGVNYEKNWKNRLLGLILLLLPFSFTACNKEKEEATGMEYTCPMHPQIVQNKPGSCPICGMDLVAKQPANAPGVAVSTDLDYLLQPSNQAVVSSVQTTHPVQKPLEQEITMSGVVTYDTRRQYIIPARFGGRVEKLYVQFNYQKVSKGQRLYDIYSPELVTAQKELLYLLQNDPVTRPHSRRAPKLRLLGATDGQIRQLARTGRNLIPSQYTAPIPAMCWIRQ